MTDYRHDLAAVEHDELLLRALRPGDVRFINGFPVPVDTDAIEQEEQDAPAFDGGARQPPPSEDRAASLLDAIERHGRERE